MADIKDAPNAMARRDLLAGGCAFAIPQGAPGGDDPAFTVAKQWCALEIEQRRLALRWQDVETWLFQNRNWPKLNDAERAAVPEAVALTVIEAQLDQIDRRYDALLPLLKKTQAAGREGLLARFEALQYFVHKDEHPDACALLTSCLGDLRRLWR